MSPLGFRRNLQGRQRLPADHRHRLPAVVRLHLRMRQGCQLVLAVVHRHRLNQPLVPYQFRHRSLRRHPHRRARNQLQLGRKPSVVSSCFACLRSPSSSTKGSSRTSVPTIGLDQPAERWNSRFHKPVFGERVNSIPMPVSKSLRVRRTATEGGG